MRSRDADNDRVAAEFALIDRIRQILGDDGAPAPGVRVGIGDDCAVLEAGALDLISTDTLVEGVHFRLDWSTPADIGYKALAVSLSDVAAMGGRPGAFLLNLTLPPDTRQRCVEALLEGMKEARDEVRALGYSLVLIGGDLTGAPPGAPLMITTTVLGKSPPGGALLRAGARPGDRIILLGPTGLAAGGLALLSEKGRADQPDDAQFPALYAAHRRPRARVHAGAMIGNSGLASAMIDTSDGLAQDLGHILRASRVGARLQADSFPRHPELVAFCAAQLAPEATSTALFAHILGGGEDFQLCFTLPQAELGNLRDYLAGHPTPAQGPGEAAQLWDIGEVRPVDEGFSVVDADGAPLDLTFTGYEHFLS